MVVFQGCLKGIFRVFLGCFQVYFISVSRVFQGYFKGGFGVIEGCFKVHFKGASRMFSGVLWVFKGVSWGASWLFQGYLQSHYFAS